MIQAQLRAGSQAAGKGWEKEGEEPVQRGLPPSTQEDTEAGGRGETWRVGGLPQVSKDRRPHLGQTLLLTLLLTLGELGSRA